MSGFSFSRKEERKNARLAKKQRRSVHHQKMINVKKLNNVVGQKKPVAVAKPVQKTQAKKPQKPIKFDHVEEEDEEEIFSDSETEEDKAKVLSKLKKLSKVSKSSKKKKQSKELYNPENQYDEDDDFLSMMDEALLSGKLTKDGFAGDKSGKIKRSSKSDESEEEDDQDIGDCYIESIEPVIRQNILRKTAPIIPTPDSISISSLAPPTSTPANAKLLRQVQSLVNKLGASNLVPICNEFEGLFRENRRKEVIELLTETIISSIVRPGGNLLDSFALNFAALSFIINQMVGIEFGAHLIEKLIETIDSLYIQSKAAKTPEEIASSNANVHERSLVNCMNFCSFLYDLQMISSNLICDLIRQSAERLDEIDVEIILKLFKTCGQQIKRDDADFMKLISSEISKNSIFQKISKDQQSSRFKFMIETINDLKDSKRKLASAMTVELEPIKKMLKNFLSQKLIAKIEPLRISLEDVRNIETKGKWWLVGSSWHPQNNIYNEEGDGISSSSTSSSKSKKNEELEKIEKLAKAQRMNTELRKSIFSTIISSDDYSDAFERLLAMKLTGKQEREIILVLVHCCGQEKVFNPFYALLAGKFASYRQGFKVTLQYTFWDCLKQIKEYPLRKLANISKLYGFLLSQSDLPISILRKGNFIRLKDQELIFWQLLLMTFFTKVSSEEEFKNIIQIFKSSIETGKSAEQQSSGRSKILSLTENVDMAEFDDDFFAAQDKIDSKNGMSSEKFEECKNLRNGLIYFLEAHFIKTEDFPFEAGIEICKKRSKIMKLMLSD